MSATPNILVIIVTWNKKDYVLNLLDSLYDLDYPREALDIMVVDNASEDGTITAIRERFPTVRLLENDENLGGTGGFNTGLRWAFEQEEGRYDYLWLLDNDVVVHRRALSALVELLETMPDAAIAGSTIMQLDYPWRINEMGAYVDRRNAYLYLNRHMEEIPQWKGVSIAALLANEQVDLSRLLMHCPTHLDVDYVAAASLLIRTSIAKQAGLWMDFFIHYDDVEWCLRIGKMGHRVLVSARSLIWHLSAAAKVPTWVLYYDNRNALYLLSKHSGAQAVKATSRRILKKALYYGLLGKMDLAYFHLDAIDDYRRGVTGKKSLHLSSPSIINAEIKQLLRDTQIKRVLIPWTINLQATRTHAQIVQVLKQRSDLQIYYLPPPAEQARILPIPGAQLCTVSSWAPLRYFQYWQMRNRHFDLVWQSDYQPILFLSWLGRENLFINDETFRRLPSPKPVELFGLLREILRRWLG